MATTGAVEDDVYDLSLEKSRWKTKGDFDELADLFDYELVFVHLTGSLTSKQEWMRQLRTHSFVRERAPTMAEAMSSSSGNRVDRQLGERQSGVVGHWPQLLDAGEDVRAQKVPYTGGPGRDRAASRVLLGHLVRLVLDMPRVASPVHRIRLCTSASTRDPPVGDSCTRSTAVGYRAPLPRRRGARRSDPCADGLWKPRVSTTRPDYSRDGGPAPSSHHRGNVMHDHGHVTLSSLSDEVGEAKVDHAAIWTSPHPRRDRRVPRIFQVFGSVM